MGVTNSNKVINTDRIACDGTLRVALAAILTEVDQEGKELQRGMKAMTIPAHSFPLCRDGRINIPERTQASAPVCFRKRGDQAFPAPARPRPWAILTTVPVRAKRAMALGITIRLLNMSVSSHTRSLDMRVPRKMKARAMTA